MIFLASSSRIRAQLLAAAGVAVSVAPHRVDERALESAVLGKGGRPEDVATALAVAKARDVAARSPDATVVAADQVLVVDGAALSKVGALDEARARLMSLRGRAHTLWTAAATRRGAEEETALVATRVTLRAFTDAALESYLNTCGAAVLSSVGCYEIEGLGATLIERIDGDYFSALGLPLFEVLASLRRFGELKT